MNTNRAGITAAKAAQTGRPPPIGLISQSRFDASVGSRPSGTSNFFEENREELNSKQVTISI